MRIRDEGERLKLNNEQLKFMLNKFKNNRKGKILLKEFDDFMIGMLWCNERIPDNQHTANNSSFEDNFKTIIK